MKTIGVIGGIGPQATMDFEARVHAISQQLIPQRANSGYPPMVVYYHRAAPMLVQADHTSVSSIQIHPDLARGAAALGAVADFLVITANGGHLVQDGIEQAAGRKVLSMIDLAITEMLRRGWQRVGLIGLGDPRVYRTPLDQRGIPYEVLDDATRGRLDEGIMALMAGQDGPADREAARAAVAALRAREVDGVILGCTEVPLLLGPDAEAPDLINPGELLAEAAVRYALADDPA
jgi:aspartate racemase